MRKSLKLPLITVIVCLSQIIFVNTAVTQSKLPDACSTSAVDDDGDDLIEICYLEDLDSIRFVLDGSSYKADSSEESLQMVRLNSPVSDPAVISMEQSALVTFSVRVYGEPTQTGVPTSITLEEVNADGEQIQILGELRDDGTLPTDLAGDWVYQGQINIPESEEGEIYFCASYESDASEIRSELYSLQVTRFPIGLQESDINFLVEDEEGFEFYTNELFVIFIEGTDPNRVEEIVSAEGGIITGSMLQINGFQIDLSGNQSIDFAQNLIERLESYPEVMSAELIGLSAPSFFSSQNNLKVIRAEEVWLLEENPRSALIFGITSGNDNG